MAKEDRDNRLDQIKEGAGLEDSRINQEFVDFLRKWSTPVLLILALIALGYYFNNQRKERRAAYVDEAFQQLNLSTSTASPSPDALKQIAEDYKNVEGVRVMALLAAADEYLRAVQRGLLPGAPLDPSTGEPESEDDYLSAEDATRFLAEAEALYKQVYELTETKPQMALHTLGALYGLAAVSESRGNADAARNMLERAERLAEDQGYFEHQTIAQMRLTALPELMGQQIILPTKADLPEIPALKPEIPEITPNPAEDGEVGPQLPQGTPEGPPQEPVTPPAGAEADPPAGGAGGGDGEGAGEADESGGEGEADDDGR